MNKSHRASGRQQAALSYSHHEPVLWLSTCSKPTWVFFFLEGFFVTQSDPEVFPSAGEASERSGKREGCALLWPGDPGEDSSVVPPGVTGQQIEEELHP